MYEILKIINKPLVPILGPCEIWYLDWKLWLGFLLWSLIWAKWLIYGYDRHFGTKAVFVLGQNLAVLVLLQEVSAVGLTLAIILCLVNAVMSMFMLAHKRDVRKKGGFTSENVYASLEKPKTQVCFIFAGQLLLTAFMLYSMSEKLHAHPSYHSSVVKRHDEPADGHVRYVYWIAAYIAVQMSVIYNRGNDSAVGHVFAAGLWENLLSICDSVDFQHRMYHAVGDDDSAYEAPLDITRANIAMRACMDFIINGLGREIISSVLPVLLMSSRHPLDFVFNSLAVTFISTLDDMSDVIFKVTDKICDSATQASYQPVLGAAPEAEEGATADDNGPQKVLINAKMTPRSSPRILSVQ
jgi:hypothetical protein